MTQRSDVLRETATGLPRAANRPYLEMRAVSYTFAGWPAVVREVDWDIASGEFHVLVGRSGCGKTTLLKLAAGLLSPDAGHIELAGAPLPAPGPHIGFVFQQPTLLDWLSVRDNVLLPLRLHGGVSEADVRHADELLDSLGLAAHVAQRPAHLSGGQQSRVSIARALIASPDILLMDEPFAALDALTREELQDALAAVCRARGTSVFFVTHDIPEAVYLADRVAVMGAGRIRHDLRVALPRPRAQSLRYSTEFNTLCAELRAALDGDAP